MMNTLIALLGDSYNRVQEIRLSVTYQELLDIILEEFTVINSKSYFDNISNIYIMSNNEIEENEYNNNANAWDGYSANIKKYISSKNDSLEYKIDDLNKKNQMLESKIERLENKIEQNNKKLEEYFNNQTE